MAEPITIYKLIILYMLSQVDFPLGNTKISNFFLDKEYTTYFTLQQALSELSESHLVKMESTRNSSRYEITSEGEETLSYFGKKISSAIVDDIDAYLKENKVRLRDEVGLISDYYRSTAQDYVVHCAIREGKTSLLDLSISVPDKEQAEHMCSRWNKENQAIYQNIMKLLMK